MFRRKHGRQVRQRQKNKFFLSRQKSRTFSPLSNMRMLSVGRRLVHKGRGRQNTIRANSMKSNNIKSITTILSSRRTSVPLRSSPPRFHARATIHRLHSHTNSALIKTHVPPVHSSPVHSSPVHSSPPRRATLRQSIGNRSRSITPMFPKTHKKSITHKSNSNGSSHLTSEYHVNNEIISLCHRILQTRRLLPPIAIPTAPPSFSLTNSSPFVDIPIFVISIRPDRKTAFFNRIRDPRIKPHHFAGTNGRSMDMSTLRRTNKLVNFQLKPGEIGCYDSHIRLLQHIVDQKIPRAIICEDDANMKCDENQSFYLDMLLKELGIEETPFE